MKRREVSSNPGRLPSECSRRQFLKESGRLAAGAGLAGSALAGVAIPKVHAGESHVIQLALIGCGGRGSGAVGNAMESTGG
ncbi:MAG TPA: twin-arginine translocation signal domain-containing protein, partial [Thermoguttaceae bacterium]|nr:twin-arginine translocation signal domain-containing protein [Thermoguttaceae bacterium]